ncbi:hypothetical protein [Micromonospora echinofusca]|uniref:DUF3040 domain-containing protein n=1 Tax=Micromonospora echinofusca TaxID=47858 RepID=A0ABS3VND8_MICEH|nr:hypothetical protein [Micromonospora echinofusca]MBO4206039.1 hypothetical protein [Micromonospora echinofusca]
MSRERARRRAEREAVAERERAARQRKRARRERWRALLRRLTPRLPDRRTGRLQPRRTRAERSGIVLVTLAVGALIWALVDDLALRVLLSLVLVLVLPAVVVIALDRRT